MREFLIRQTTAADYLDGLAEETGRYSPFNLMLIDGASLSYYASTGLQERDLEPGIYGLSNAVLDTPWPKVQRLKTVLEAAVQAPDPVPMLFEALADAVPAEDHLLPDTGLDIAAERRLSAPFIRSSDYGTRCSTVIVRTGGGTLRFAEHRFDAAGTRIGEDEFTFRLEPIS